MKRHWKHGDAYCGTALEAINFALDSVDGPWEKMEFLRAWREGDLEEWPEFTFEAQRPPLWRRILAKLGTFNLPGGPSDPDDRAALDREQDEIDRRAL